MSACSYTFGIGLLLARASMKQLRKSQKAQVIPSPEQSLCHNNELCVKHISVKRVCKPESVTEKGKQKGYEGHCMHKGKLWSPFRTLEKGCQLDTDQCRELIAIFLSGSFSSQQRPR